MRPEDIPRSYLYLFVALVVCLVFYVLDTSDEETEGLVLTPVGDVRQIDDARADGERQTPGDGQGRLIAAVSQEIRPLASPFTRSASKGMPRESTQLPVPQPLPPVSTTGTPAPQVAQPICKGIMHTGQGTMLFLHYDGQDLALGVGETKQGVTLLALRESVAEIAVHGQQMTIYAGD